MSGTTFLQYKIEHGSKYDLLKSLQLAQRLKYGVSVHFSAAHGFVEAEKDDALKDVFMKDLLICDSKPLANYLRLFSKEIHQIRGTTFMRLAISAKGLEGSHFFLGSTEETLSKLVTLAHTINPKVNICGTYSPPFTNDLELLFASCSQKIDKFRPDFVWVGLGAPKQFTISHKLSQKYQGVFLSVGAAFEFVSNVSPEAPALLQRLSLEWLHRFILQPRKLFKRYLFGNSYFLFMMVKDFFRRGILKKI